MLIKKLLHRFSIWISIIGIAMGIAWLFSGYFSLKKSQRQYVKNIDEELKNVLFLSSYTQFFESTADQLKGIKEVFGTRNITLSEEFMNTKVYNSDEHIENFYQLFRYKIKNFHSRYDGVLLGDDAALNFFETYGKELFPETPVIFFGIDNPDNAERVAQNPYVTGSIERIYISDTILQAAKIFPKTKRIVAIADDTPTGIGNQKQLNEISAKFPDYQFDMIVSSRFSKKALEDAIQSVSGDSIILFLGFFDDADGNIYTLSSCAEFVGKNATVPIFTKQIMSVGNGPFGGKIIDYVETGRVAAQLLCDVFDGKVKIQDVKVYKDEKADFYFDYALLKKFNVSRSKLPKGSILVNKPKSYFEQYKIIIFPSICIFFFLGMLFIIVITSYMDARRYATALERSEKELVFSAGHDYLTSLPNRMLARAEVDRMLAEKHPFALMMLDVDDFKSINDFFGHIYGDEVLREIGTRLHALELDGDFFACRSGGDEFLLIYRSGTIDDGDAKMYYIREILNSPFVFEGKRIFIRLCIGLMNYDGKMEATCDSLVANADVALYAAKANGKNKFVFFTNDMRDSIMKEKEVALQLEDACNNDGFSVMYQPQIDATTGEVQGYEALVRLSTLNLPPQVFIPIAEKNALMIQIGRIVTKKVVEQMAEWKKEGRKMHKVAINYSSGQIADTGYVHYLKSLLDENEIAAEYISIEVTESLFMSNLQYAKELFKALSDIGVSLTLDDFGTGYSSLSYLTYLPVDTVKIDKSWIDSYLQEGKDTFIKNIVRLVHSLNMRLTVEGVEEKWQYDKLKEFECDSVQGYYFSKPVIAAEVV